MLNSENPEETLIIDESEDIGPGIINFWMGYAAGYAASSMDTDD